MPKYIVKSELQHDGMIYPKGAAIVLEGKHAKELHGVLAPYEESKEARPAPTKAETSQLRSRRDASAPVKAPVKPAAPAKPAPAKPAAPSQEEAKA